MRPWYAFGLDEAGNDEKALFFVTASALFLLAIIGLVNPQFLNSTLTGAYDWVLNYFGWWFMALGFALLIFSFFMVLSRYGNIRIGGQDAEPEFGTFSWLAMVFTVGYSGSIIIWGVGEPVSIVNSPPPQPLPVTGASIESLALSFMFIHEVFPGLAMWYPPFALAFGLIVYTRGTDDYKFSSMLKVIFGEKDRKVYWIVDLAALIAIVGGVAAAIGFTGQVYAALMSNVFGLESSVYTYGLFVVVGLIFLGDVWLGLRKGIRNASRITIVLMILSFGLVLVVGPTLFILEIGLDAAGIWLSNMLRLSLYTAPTAAAANWPQGWTSFWWAWWAAWGLFVGSFVARVSKGRTIRETFVFLVVIPGFLLWVLHSIIGGWVLAPGYIGPGHRGAIERYPGGSGTSRRHHPVRMVARHHARARHRGVRAYLAGFGGVYPLGDHPRQRHPERPQPGVVGGTAFVPRDHDARTARLRCHAGVPHGTRVAVYGVHSADSVRQLHYCPRVLRGELRADGRGPVRRSQRRRTVAVPRGHDRRSRPARSRGRNRQRRLTPLVSIIRAVPFR